MILYKKSNQVFKAQAGTKTNVPYRAGDRVTYGTPEYKEAYDKGEVVSPNGIRSPIALNEVVVKGKPKGFWKQSIGRYVKDHAEDGVLGAIGSVVTYPMQLAQDAVMYGLTDKVQRPSEGLDIKNKWGALATDAVLDPTNLVGAGAATNIGKLSKFKTVFNSGVGRVVEKVAESSLSGGTGSIIKGLKNKVVSKALGSSNNKAFLEKYLTAPKKGKILLPSGNKGLKKIPLGGGPSKPWENTLWVDDATEDVAPIIDSRIRYDDLSSLMEKHGKDFSKKYGTKYTEKDLGLYAKMEAINKDRLQTQSYYSMGTDIEVSDKFIDKHGIARQYDPMDELLTDAYTQGYDSRINNRVNQHEAEASTAFYRKEVTPKLEELIKKNKLKSPEVLYRGESDYALKKVWRDGVKQPNGSVKYSELQKGDVFKPGSFLSTSISRQKADNFGKLSSEITAPAGQSILFPNATGVRNFFPEKEVLLPRKLKYRVDDIVETPLGGRNIDGTSIVSRLFKHSIVNPYTTVGAVAGASMINKNK